MTVIVCILIAAAICVVLRSAIDLWVNRGGNS